METAPNRVATNAFDWGPIGPLLRRVGHPCSNIVITILAPHLDVRTQPTCCRDCSTSGSVSDGSSLLVYPTERDAQRDEDLLHSRAIINTFFYTCFPRLWADFSVKCGTFCRTDAALPRGSGVTLRTAARWSRGRLLQTPRSGSTLTRTCARGATPSSTRCGSRHSPFLPSFLDSFWHIRLFCVTDIRLILGVTRHHLHLQ